MRLPVTRANPAKNHSAKVFNESAVTNLFVVDDPIADRGDKTKEVFDSREIKRKQLFSGLWAPMVQGTSMVARYCLSYVGFAFYDKGHPSADVVNKGKTRGLGI